MLASILFISYNHSRFVAEAIRAAMAQDYPNLELVICDDASPDDTRAVLESELTHCPSHISVIRADSETNVGLIANFNRGMAACTGDVVVLMAGDDVSLPNRVSRIVEEFARSPKCMLVYTNWIRIDEEGRELAGECRHPEDKTFSHGSLPSCIYANGKGPGATAAYRRQIFETFGPLDPYKRPEDRSCWFRALLLGDVRYLAVPLVKWRTHAGNWCNYQSEADSAAARNRILKDLHCRENYGRQFKKDIHYAITNSLIPQSLASRLLFLIEHERERERLRRLSLAKASWKSWLGSACRLMRVSPSFGNLWRIARSDLPIRVFTKKRESHWKRKIHKR